MVRKYVCTTIYIYRTIIYYINKYINLYCKHNMLTNWVRWTRDHLAIHVIF